MPDRISEVSSRMLRYFGADVRRINHALKVHGFAFTIAGQEGLRDEALTILQAAALLHDIGIKNAERLHNSSAGNWQELEGSPVARELLAGLTFPPEAVERICFLIGHHHSYPKIDGPDFQILVEADFLVNAFEDQMPRESLESVGRKYFKTDAGWQLMKTLYLC